LPKGFSAWTGNDGVDVAVTRILRTYRGRIKHSMDYSGFDKSIPGPLIDAAMDVIEHWVTVDLAEKVRLTGAIIKTIPIVVPEMVLSGRTGGMPSGSVVTNLVDSLVNLIAGYYIAVRNDTTLLDYEVMGDDSIFVWEDVLTPEVIGETVAELGLTSNAEKQFISDTSVHYLQRLHCDDYVVNGLNVGVRSIFRHISPATGYETLKKEWTSLMDTVRLISLMQECQHDPRFVPFVRYWYDSDSVLRSGMDPVTIFKKAGGADVIREALGTKSFPFARPNPEGVNEWKTTQVIRSFRN